MKLPSIKRAEELYKCSLCGWVHPVIWRKDGEKRDKKHKKWLPCLKCGVDNNFIKIN